MDGNSLGLSSKDSEEALLDVFNVWKKEGIKIWGTREGYFFNLSRNIAKKLKSLINADETGV